MNKRVFSKNVLRAYKKQVPLLEKMLMPILNNITITNIDGIFQYSNLPESKMRLYCAVVNHKRTFFDTEDELVNFINSSVVRVDDVYIIDYLDEVYDRDRVFKVTYKNGHEMLYSKVDEYGFDGYAIHDPHKSFSFSKNIWNFHYGNLDDIYKALIDRGFDLNYFNLKLVNKGE